MVTPPLFFGSPRTAGPQPRDVLRLALPCSSARLGRRGPRPATSCGSHSRVLRLASDGGGPAPRPPAARTPLGGPLEAPLVQGGASRGSRAHRAPPPRPGGAG